MKKIKLLLVLVITLFACFLFACGENGGNEEIDWSSKTVSDIGLVNETFYASYEYDEFQLSMLKIHVSYTDGTSRDISVTEDMLSEKDLNKLKSTGKPRITIDYEGYTVQGTVKLIDSSELDQNLNVDGKYACVIKAIRDAEKGIINFIFEANEEYEVCAMNFAFTFDQTIMQLSNATLNSELGGIGKVTLEDGKILFAYSENATSLKEDVTLFTVSYTGDYRASKLAVSKEYNNKVYVADYATYETELVTNVLYHVSAK